MKAKIHNILLLLILFLVFFANYIQAQETENTHFINGIFGSPPAQYEFKDVSLKGYLTSFPMDEIKEVLGNEAYDSLNIDYWIYTSFTDVEMAIVEKLELSSLSLENTIDFPLEDGIIGDNCWQSIEETGSVLFSRNNALVFISPQGDSSFNPNMIEESARKIDSVLIENREARYGDKVPAPEISDFEIVRYPKNWNDSLTIKIESINPDSTNQFLYYRKYGDNYDTFSETGELTVSLNKNTDSTTIDGYSKVKVWVYNENNIVNSITLTVHLMNYPGKYMLSAIDLPDFELTKERIFDKGVNENEGIYGILQRWKIPSIENDKYIEIEYYEFENEQKAILGMTYNSGSIGWPYSFGNFNGEFLGNISLIAGNSLILFQKWNVGITLHLSYNSNIEDRNEFPNISNKILSKINDSISTTYFAKDRELKLHQVSEDKFNQLTKNANSLLINSNYSEIKSDDTKWVYSEDSLIMGLRKQWVKDKSLFTIDIVQTDNNANARLVGKKRNKISWGMNHLLPLNNTDSLDLMINAMFQEFRSPRKYYSTAGFIDNYAIYLHCQHEDSVDINLFKSVLKSFYGNGTEISNIKQNNIQIYPNPAYETLTIEIQNTETTFAKLLDLTGRLIKTLPIENGTKTYNISELESGVYFIQIPQKEGMVVRKFVKN